MIEVSTEYHTAKSDVDALPDFKCMGTCKKVWWKGDIKPATVGMLIHCPKCNGVLASAKEGLDYKVLQFEPGVKVFPKADVDVKHASNLLEEFFPLEEKYGWK